MAATVQIHEMTASDTGTDKTDGTVRFKSADETSVDTNNRLTIPTSGTDYSYTKQLQLNVTVAPDTDLQDLEAYSDGGNGFEHTRMAGMVLALASASSTIRMDRLAPMWTRTFPARICSQRIADLRLTWMRPIPGRIPAPVIRGICRAAYRHRLSGGSAQAANDDS